jgi:hypothetical protein
MPLRDHFHPPLGELRHWESFLSRWASAIADTLESDWLPPGYFAEVQIHVGSRVEVDIATMEDELSSPEPPSSSGGTGTATAVPAKLWTPLAPAMTFDAFFPDRVEVLIFQTEAGPTLVAAVELVSPRNKDRRVGRRAFAIKCANYLRHGIGLVVVDVVTNRRANLHNEMIDLLELPEDYRIDPDALYAVAYRPVKTGDRAVVQVWPGPVAVGDELPTLPLPLDKGQCLRFDLEATYTAACRRMRLPEE